MHTKIDGFDSLVDACRDADSYPKNSIREDLSSSELDGYWQQLNDEKDRLFDEDNACIDFWEKRKGDGKFRMTTVGRQQLSGHLSSYQIDPNCRFIFIESDHSRAELNCSKDMLQYLLTYHQVDPSFLDYVHTFGDQAEPLDACLCHFQYDDNLSGTGTPIPRLGRSGIELRHSYLLRTVERAHEPTIWPWSVRQTAVYHSFDLVEGRALWITIKGNDRLSQIIRQDTADGCRFRTDSPASAFEMDLKTQLIYLKWCQQDWRWFVRDTENDIRKILINTRTAPVDRKPHFQSSVKEAGNTSARFGSPLSTALERAQTTRALGSLWSSGIVHKLSELRNTAQHTVKRELIQQYSEPILELEMFNFKDLQKLNTIGERTEEAILIIKLNIKVLQDLHKYYLSVLKMSRLPDGCSALLTPFLDKVQSIIGTMETRKLQLESLYHKLGEGKSLFESILQYRALQVNQIFAEKSEQSAMNMERIAYRTANETASMHIITVVTLIFLPGTFLASFFQSGVLQWSDIPAIPDGWVLRPEAISLFFEICIPLMGFIFLIWFGAAWSAERRYKRLSADRLEVVSEQKQRLSLV
ncbi:hypothetical protein BJ170DRAFT_621301 [Xylariales sp. AK1849]|nr:hypothetical protein BJ170DRAFT_621301 [Xylariales sp. AK1849]